MLNEIYLSKECCEKLEISYFSQKEEISLEPSKALLLRRDWDCLHKETFHMFILAETEMRLSPKWVREGIPEPGWFTVLNPPKTRFTVAVDVEIDILRQQRNLLLDLCDVSEESHVELLSGIITMCDDMIDNALLSLFLSKGVKSE